VTGGESEQPPEGASFDVQQFFEPNEIIETHRLYSSGGNGRRPSPLCPAWDGRDELGTALGRPRPQQSSMVPGNGTMGRLKHPKCHPPSPPQTFVTRVGCFRGWTRTRQSRALRWQSPTGRSRRRQSAPIFSRENLPNRSNPTPSKS
jgi:hypothetical protein